MLKVKDYEIRWMHDISPDSSHKLGGVPRQGFRAVTICNIDPVNCDSGFARCSWADNFSRDKGRKLSLSRALLKANISKKDRTMIWEAYRVMGMPEGKRRW